MLCYINVYSVFVSLNWELSFFPDKFIRLVDKLTLMPIVNAPTVKSSKFCWLDVWESKSCTSNGQKPRAYTETWPIEMFDASNVQVDTKHFGARHVRDQSKVSHEDHLD